MPSDEEAKLDENGKKIKNLSVEQSIKDRFFGVSDPLANKMLTKIKKEEKPQPPENKNITTLFLGGVEDDLTETDIVEFFKKYGKVKGIRMRPKAKCAFICFENRSSTEFAVEHLYSKLFIKERRLKINWAKDQLDPSKHSNKRTNDEYTNPADESKLASMIGNHSHGKLVIEADKGYYPSMDPANYVSLQLN